MLDTCIYIYLCHTVLYCKQLYLKQTTTFPALSRPELIIRHWKKTKNHQVSTWSTSPSSSLGRDPLRSLLEWCSEKGLRRVVELIVSCFWRTTNDYRLKTSHPHPVLFWCSCCFTLRTNRYLSSPRRRKDEFHTTSQFQGDLDQVIKLSCPNCVLPPSLWCSWFAVPASLLRLFYFLSPVLGESMASREKDWLPSILETYLPRKVLESGTTNDLEENDHTCGNQPFLSDFILTCVACIQEIQSDIEDAIAKYNEATSRLAEAEKNKAQADQVPPGRDMRWLEWCDWPTDCNKIR